ncbi:MAG: serine aminopeptidase domain-containing protein [Alphaproteobacteria bacterium]
MGVETSFEENDLTTDIFRYKRTQSLVRNHPTLRLWGVTNGFAKAINERFKIIRQKGWVEKINMKILVFNNLKDRVVDANKIESTAARLPNKEIITFSNTEHEIFMEKDIYRKKMWEKIDAFLK